jgi:C4-dicarboxylate transporter, DctQ subunit
MAAKGSRFGGLVAAVLHALEETLIGLLLAVMTVTTLYQLAMARFDDGPGRTDLGAWLLAWLVLLGMSYAVRVNAHLGIDALVKLFGPGPRRLFGLLAAGAGLAYGTLMLAGAWDHVAGLYRLRSEAGGVPPWLLAAILPAGFALLLYRLLQAGVRIWTRRQEGLLQGDEAAAALTHHLASLAASPDPPAPRKARLP